MPVPGEHKTVQARILAYAQEIGWTFVPRAEAAGRRGLTEGGFSNPPLPDQKKGGQECPLSVEGTPRAAIPPFLSQAVREMKSD